IDKMAHENNLRVLDELIASKEQRRTSLLGGGGVAELRKQIAEIDAAIAERKNELREAGAGDRHQIQNQKYTLQSEILRLQAEERDTAAAIATAKNERDQASEEVERERANWHTVNDTEPAIDDTNTTCPTCGQELPADQIAAARETALANFNQDKAQKLGAITERGKAAKRRADLAIEKIAKLDQALAGIIAEKALRDAELQEIEATIAAQIATTTAPADDLQHKVLTAQKAQTEIELAELTRSSSTAIAAVDEEIAAKKAARAQSTEALQKLERYAQGGIRISQLKSQETKLATEYEKLEQELYLTEEFIKTKVELLEEKINGHFEHARFRMYNTFIAGGIEPTCETLFKGVPYGTNLNNGARINVGLDIIRTLSRHYSFEAPIFIDNAEAITQLIETPAQMIKLYHIPGIKELEVVVEQPAAPQEKK
ncbi:MAG TPA: hypothetical protein VLH56_06120, partial [Dissulfurispiraceae bacterium]|nr:hypothetical protein [Dissulfurispiraceae bacterium]